MSKLDVYGLTLADSVTTKKGAKFAAARGSQPWSPGPLKVPFQPGNFDGKPSSKVNMVFNATAEVLEQLRELDAWAKIHIQTRSERLVGKQLSTAEVQYRYRSCVKESSLYEPTFKCKVDLDTVGMWDSKKAPAQAPESWRGLTVQPRLQLKGLWITEKEFGLQFEVLDVMLPEQTEAVRCCPF
jgi:hypothetical protein